MERRADWSAIVPLVGDGQEINTGEAGITAWFEALQRRSDSGDLRRTGRRRLRACAFGPGPRGPGPSSRCVGSFA